MFRFFVRSAIFGWTYMLEVCVASWAMNRQASSQSCTLKLRAAGDKQLASAIYFIVNVQSVAGRD